MNQLLTLYSWFTILLILMIIVIDTLLAFKFKRFYRASGFGILTCTLMNFVFVQALSSLFYCAASITIIVTEGQAIRYIYLFRDVGTIWLISSSLMHMVVITFLRIFSVSYGKRFISFISSRLHIGLVLMEIWAASVGITLVCLVSRTTVIYSVFYIGILITGCFAIVCFYVTIGTSFDASKLSWEKRQVINPICPNELKRKNTDAYRPRKTYALFSGLVISFITFSLPAAIPNLTYNLQGKLITPSISFIVSLWLLIGVVFNSLWLLLRLRSAVNHTSSFYAKWTPRNDRESVVYLDVNRDGCSTQTRLLAPSSYVQDFRSGPEAEFVTI